MHLLDGALRALAARGVAVVTGRSCRVDPIEEAAVAHPNATNQTLPLSAAQATVLTAAAGRPDGALIRPERLRGNAVTALTDSLLTRAFVRRVAAKADLPVWRHDPMTEKPMALVLTKLGRQAIDPECLSAAARVPKAKKVDLGAQADREPGADVAGPNTASVIEAPLPTAAVSSTPRPNSKLAVVVGLLSRDTGATIDELMAATGWLPHTTRAALTGLRKRGYGLHREPRDGSTAAYHAKADNMPEVGPQA